MIEIILFFVGIFVIKKLLLDYVKKNAKKNH